MDKTMLTELISKREKEYENNKFKRTIYTILFFALIMFIIIYINNEVKGIEIIGLLLGSIFCSIVYFFINAYIFMTLFKKSEEENKLLEELKAKLSKMK